MSEINQTSHLGSVQLSGCYQPATSAVWKKRLWKTGSSHTSANLYGNDHSPQFWKTRHQHNSTLNIHLFTRLNTESLRVDWRCLFQNDLLRLGNTAIKHLRSKVLPPTSEKIRLLDPNSISPSEFCWQVHPHPKLQSTCTKRSYQVSPLLFQKEDSCTCTLSETHLNMN
jgi:hypothetical protein